MNTTAFTHVPPGFRFHPTDEELVDYYLRRKVASIRIDLDVIKDVDLYRIEPWDLQVLCGIGTEEQDEWYFFSHKDKKYPTGTRTNRATAAGFWKATGRDKAIYSKNELIGMRKTLVFYKGRAPNGQKSDWIMHEYRLETDENGTPQEEGWVVCRVFKKKIATVRKMCDNESPLWYDEPIESPKQNSHHHMNVRATHYPYVNNTCKKEMDHHQLQYYNRSITITPPDHFLQLPLLESPKMPSFGGMNPNAGISSLQSLVLTNDIQSTFDHNQNFNSVLMKNAREQCGGDDDDDLQLTDWRVLDKFVASQLSHDQEISKENVIDSTFDASEELNLISRDFNNEQAEMVVHEHGLISSSRCHIDMWK